MQAQHSRRRRILRPLFVGLLSAAYLNLAFVAVSEKMIDWFSLGSEPWIWISFVASMVLLGLVVAKG